MGVSMASGEIHQSTEKPVPMLAESSRRLSMRVEAG